MNIPADYASASVYDLLQAASRGLIGLDRRFLHALVDHPARSIPDLLRFGREDHEDDRVDLGPELLAVFRYLRTPEALPYYLDSLHRQTEDADDDLIEGVIALGADALEPLVNLYHELGEEQGSEVAFVLAGLGVRDERILGILLERLEYDAADGALCLGLYGDPAAIPAIEKMIAEVSGDDELVRELSDAIEEIRNHGERQMDTAGEFDLFAHYPEEAGPDFDSLADEDRMLLLSHEAPEIRAHAARSFFQRKFPLEIRARLLAVARTDEAPQVRGRAWEALADIEDKELRSEMLRRATAPDTDPDERAGLVVALAEDAEKPGIRAAIIELYEYPNTRAKALEAMWRSFDRGFARCFPPHLEDADPDIRRQAIMGAGYLGIGAEAERLRKYFEDEEWRADALFAYALSVPAEISRGRMPGLLRRIDRVANRLSAGETELVELALDQRLMLHGLEPVFSGDDGGDLPAEGEEAHAHVHEHVGRNDPCPCGSGKKYKKCCGAA